ncbi:hypothetical protein GCM10027403_01300 [Arthrobacter tecti]
MNSHQDPPSTPDEPADRSAASGESPSTEPTPTATNRPAGAGGFFGWLRSLNVVRGQDRWIGGVASGIAARTGLDPILVRGLFVVLAIFGGIGLLAYGLAWALLPEPDGRIHAESAARGSWTSGMTGALVVSILGLWRPNVPFFGSTGGFGGFIWSLFWIGVVVFIVYWISNSANRKKADAGAPDAGTPVPTDGHTAHTMPLTVETPRDQTAQYAPHTFHPRPYTPPVNKPQKAPKPVVPGPSGADVAVFLGGAVLLAGLVLALDYLGLLSLGGDRFTVAVATGVVVIGLGVVLMGMRGQTSGVLGFLAAVGLIASIVSAAVPSTGNWVLATQGQWSISSVEPAEEGYTVVAGQGRLDLTDLDGITEDVIIPVNAAAGNVGILVPEDVPVDVRSMVALSSTELVTAADTTTLGGIWRPGTLHIDEGAEGPRIILDVRGVVSHVTVSTTEAALEDTESGQQR